MRSLPRHMSVGMLILDKFPSAREGLKKDMEGITNQDGIFEKFFYEQEFNPIALYKIEPDLERLGSDAIRYIDVNHAYEVVH